MKKMIINTGAIFLLVAMLSIDSNCTKNSGGSGKDSIVIVPPPVTPVDASVAYWVTKADQSILLQQQTNLSAFGNPTATTETITIDSTQTFQTIDGFGYTLTGGSANLINAMTSSAKADLLTELFSASGIGISYLRLSLGSSDLNQSVFSYDDMPAGQTDVNLNNFSLSQDTVDLIPVLKQILTINSNIKLLASPWCAPAWMTDNGKSSGGSLLNQYFNSYAQYFVKYIKAMQANGIKIDAITVQNEPENAGNNPSMVMHAQQQADFVKNALGPAFQAAGLTTKIIIWDHNCDLASYPLTVLNDAAAYQYINGSAFHLYSGDISALSTVHNAYPNKNLYFTEQWTGSTGSFSGDLQWHLKNVIIGSMKNWSKNALEWNLANDPNYQPHTPGGCSQCKGAITLSGSFVTRNVGYYIIAHAAKFVPSGSIRIASNSTGQLSNVAFKKADGGKVLIVLNDQATAQTITVNTNSKTFSTILPVGTVATFVW